MTRDWRSISYLQEGNGRQRKLFAALQECKILSKLQRYDPAVVSTICVGLDINSSDVDIICSAEDPSSFVADVATHYSRYDNYEMTEQDDIAVISFSSSGFLFEIYASPLPVEEQRAYRHLSVMQRLLQLGKETFRDAIRSLKENGLKTEPAIAEYLGLTGDPFEAVLKLEELNDEELSVLLLKE